MYLDPEIVQNIVLSEKTQIAKEYARYNLICVRRTGKG